ncbi:MAG: Porin [Thermodesulfobacteriota bacterium]|nr:Porin [Thermodesulfobacteriota bacterium]
MRIEALICRRFFKSLLLFLLFSLIAASPGAGQVDTAMDNGIPEGGIIANPQTAYTFLGWDQLGSGLGLKDEWGVRLGGFMILEPNWIASGGGEPNSAHASLAMGIHTSVDLHKAIGIPGGTLGVEFLGFTGDPITNAAGCVQMFSNMDGAPPRSRIEMMQAWWHQRIFDDKLIFHIGKMNAAGHFGTVTKPVFVTEGHLQDSGSDISSLIWVPVGLNPTVLSIFPAYYNTAYGATVHFAPTRDFYASYGLFDGNFARGVQTGLRWGPQFNEYKLHIGELGYSWRVGKNGKPGRLGAGVWGQTGDLYTPALTIDHGETGYYMFANQRLWYRRPGINNSGLIGYFQYGHTGADSVMVNEYVGAGLSGVGLVPGRPYDTISMGMAWSRLNDLPGAGAFFYPDVQSDSKDLRGNELMLQAAYLTTFVFKTSSNFWTLTSELVYTCIPTPGQRPDLDAAHVFTARFIVLF